MKVKNFLAVAGFSFVLAFVFSCAGNDGIDGRDGRDGSDGKDGISCVAEPKEKAADGYDILCDGEKIGEIQNGKLECLLDSRADGRINVICNDEKIGELRNGTSCDVEDIGVYFVMKCGDVEKAKWAKALCGKDAYDPDTYTCTDGVLTSFIDDRNNMEYNIVKIGNKIWLAEDLIYRKSTFTWAEAIEACPIGWELPEHSLIRGLVDDDALALNLSYDNMWWSATENSEALAYVMSTNSSSSGNIFPSGVVLEEKSKPLNIRCVMSN